MTDEELEQKLKEKGMISLANLLSGQTPIAQFQAHVGVIDVESFGAWLERKRETFIRMRLEYEVGNKDKDDLYEWIFAHSAVFNEVCMNWRKANGLPPYEN